MTKLAIRNLSRNPLRVGVTRIPGDGSTTLVDDSDGNVQRDLRNHSGQWAQVAAGDSVAGATFGALTGEVGEARTQSIQLVDAAGDALAQRGVVDVFISTDAAGDAPGDGDLTIALSAGTDGALIGTDESGATFVSEADGDLDVVLTDSGAATDDVFLHVVVDGKIVASSDAIAFAA